jgi:hypothetical protein
MGIEKNKNGFTRSGEHANEKITARKPHGHECLKTKEKDVWIWQKNP